MTQIIDPEVLRVELHYYIDNTSDTELEGIYTFINSKAETYKWWEDEDLMAELERRSNDLKSGKDKGVSWEESKARLLGRLSK
jgi:putative addiction module component (TIGR02574 family)